MTIPRNFLVIMSDEHRRDAMGCMGHPLVQTPNLDRLAQGGTVFENAYTPSPMCVPARAAVACGDHVHRIRHWDSATPYDGKHRSWMHQLRDAGHNVASIGKLHFRSENDDNGFSEEILPMHVVNGIGWAVGLLRENPPLYESAAELAADVGIGESSYTDYDKQIVEAAETWLGERSMKDEPWAAFVSLVSPHYPLTAPIEFSRLYDPANVPLPIGYPSKLAPEHSELANVASFFDYDRYFDEAKMREAIAAYFALTSFMDSCVGRILAALENTGQAEHTTVIYVSDHGEMLGDHGFWTKQVMYEASAGVPMILSGPGVPAQRRVKTATSLLDIAPTAAAVMGAPSEGFSGDDLRKIANEGDDLERGVFSEYHDGGSTTATFMVRWKNWKYIHYVGHEPQLFDLSQDPNERLNLATNGNEDPAAKEALAEGERRLSAICDPNAVNAACFKDQSNRIEELGGREACRDAFVFNHTPTPI